MLDTVRSSLPMAPYPELRSLVGAIEKKLRTKFPAEWEPRRPLSVYVDENDPSKAIVEVAGLEGKNYLIAVYGTRVMFVVPKESAPAL